MNLFFIKKGKEDENNYIYLIKNNNYENKKIIL